METKHTPGPWTLRMRRKDSAVVETRDRTIASIMQYGDTDREADANARLIAAAPEMLTLLKRVAAHPAHFEPGLVLSARDLLARIEKA